MVVRADYGTRKFERPNRQAYQFTKDFIGSFGDAFAGFVSGAKSAKDAFGSFAGSLYQESLKLLANKALQSIFESFQPGGGGFGSLLGNFTHDLGFNPSLGTIGAGLASGGVVTPGSFHEVNENDPELYQQGGKAYLMGGSQSGRVIPMQPAKSGVTYVTNVNVQPTSSRRAADQVATEVYRKQRLAVSRGGL